MRLIAAIVLLLSALSASALERITATVTFTNAPTTNGMTFTVNGSVRTWTNTVFVSGTQVLTNLLATGSKTNFYRHVGLAPFTSVIIRDTGPTNVTLTGNAGVAMAVSASAGYVSIVLSTQTVSQAWDVRVPYSTEVAAQQTNIWSLVGAALNFQGITNAINEASQIATNLVGRTNSQTISGIKLWSGSNWFSAIHATNPKTTNLVNYGNAVSSKGSGASSEQFGTSATASGENSLAVGRLASVSVTGTNALAVGNLSIASTNGAVAIGAAAEADGLNSIAIGGSALAAYDNSTAIGTGATPAGPNQIRLGTSSQSVSVAGNLRVSGLMSNNIFASSNTFSAGSDISFTRYANASLANGNNAAVVVGTNIFVQVSGPSGAFSINGIAGGRDGKWVIILNRTGQNMTIANDSGVDPVAANRIYTLTGGDVATTADGCATLIYNATDSRWILTAIQQ